MNWAETSAMGPVLALEIEWMEIEPFQRQRRGSLVPDQISHRREELEAGLQALGVPYTWTGAVLRITGHVRNGAAQEE